MGKVAQQAQESTVDLVDNIVKGILKDENVSLKDFFVGVHNAFAHGEAMEDNYTFTDEQLTKMFVHFDALIKISKEIESN